MPYLFAIILLFSTNCRKSKLEDGKRSFSSFKWHPSLDVNLKLKQSAYKISKKQQNTDRTYRADRTYDRQRISRIPNSDKHVFLILFPNLLKQENSPRISQDDVEKASLL